MTQQTLVTDSSKSPRPEETSETPPNFRDAARWRTPTLFYDTADFRDTTSLVVNTTDFLDIRGGAFISSREA